MIILILLQLCLLALLLFFSAFFSSAEVAFFSLNPVQVDRLGAKDPDAAERIRKTLKTPTKLLSAILIGNTLVNIFAASIGYHLVHNFTETYAEVISIPLMTLLLLIFGEIGPKRLAIQHPVQLAVLYTPYIKSVMTWVKPIRYGLEAITKRLAVVFRPRGHILSKEEVAGVMEISHQKGLLDADERAMLTGIMRLEQLQASDVMTPRVDIIGIDLDDPPADMLGRIQSVKVPYLLIYRKTLDEVNGFLDVRSYLMDPGHNIQQAWNAPVYIPETAPLNNLLAQFQKEQRRLAVVVDEYGGTAGIISRGDILEEITGSIDEPEEFLFETLGLGRWLVDGQMNIEELNEKLDLKLDSEGIDRLSGWIMSKAGRLLSYGESVEAEGVRATVRKIRKHRITLVLLEKLKEENS